MKTVAITCLILAVSFTAVSLAHFPESPLAFVLMFFVASSLGVTLKRLDTDRPNAR